jgi:hypothetical protein
MLIARRYVSGRTRDWLKFKNPGGAGGEAGALVPIIR